MAIDVKNPNYGLGRNSAYVTVNGAWFAIVCADAWSGQSGSRNAPASHDNSLSVLLGNLIKGSGKYYGVETVKLTLKRHHPPVCHSMVHRAIYYPDNQVTLAAASRKKPRSCNPAPRKTGRGKVGVGGMRARSHN
ncbi:hypothetical protein [Paraburkholderia diazotrophica]|uniref:Uncharacterized protein n=1 Tax=Paraburkholderia diazotrophica TaxID=667676 RepID=A0A1H7ED34_9BURK|nr:hypothetical protein [Paraburkholderia diazotrophica]SEK08545.1 hypothetical protein SAMN05192539_104142 [Paraburkholderia diazotrophica]